MRLPSITIAIAMLLIVSLTPVQAQTVFTGPAVYQFEDYIADMTYGGTWLTQTTMSVVTRTGTSAGASVSFLASGRYLVIWRYQRSTGISSRFNACVNASCVAVISESTNSENQWVPSSFPLPVGTNTITITQTSGNITFDYFMILDDVAGSFPTPVPTATIVPSATPASTTTPQPTPTPQPTATPYELPGVIFAIDPEKSYGSIDGQITSMDYTATAADVHLSNLLLMLLFSVWGMFLLQVFVLSRHKK